MQSALPASVAAGARLFHFRWSSTTHLALITKVSTKLVCTAALATPAPRSVGWYTAGNWVTRAAYTGVSLVGGPWGLARRQSYPNTLIDVLDIAVASTAAGLGSAGGSLNGNAIAGDIAVCGGTVGSINMQHDLYYPVDKEVPLVVGANEGLVLANGAVAFPTTAQYLLSVEISWAEILLSDWGQ